MTILNAIRRLLGLPVKTYPAPWIWVLPNGRTVFEYKGRFYSDVYDGFDVRELPSWRKPLIGKPSYWHYCTADELKRRSPATPGVLKAIGYGERTP